MPTLSSEKRRGRNWVLRPICMSMLVTGFWIPGQRSAGMKVCAFHGGGVFLGPLHLTVACPTQNAKFKLTHPMLRPPRGPPLSQWENWLWHTLPGQRPGAHRNQQKQGCDGARAAAAVRQRAPVAAETSVPTLGLDPVLVQFIRVTLPKTLYLSESQPLTKTELSRLIRYSRNGLSLGST